MDEKIPTVVILRIGTDQTSIVCLVQLFLILNTGYVSIENLFRITVASTVFGNAEMFDVSDFAILSDAKIGSIRFVRIEDRILINSLVFIFDLMQIQEIGDTHLLH